MSNFITNLLLIKDQNITMEDKLDLINVDGQDTFVFHGQCQDFCVNTI